MLLLGFWLIYWLLILALILFFGGQIIGAFQAGKTDIFIFIMGFAVFFGILMWGVRGIFAAYVLFWQIAGLEILEISHNNLKVRKTIFGIGKTKQFEKDRIKSITVGNAIILPFAFTKFKSTSFDVAITGQILINSEGRKTEYLGLGLESQEAEKIINLLQKQLFSNRA